MSLWRPRTFDGSLPPARRETDRFIAMGLSGVALFGWVIVARVATTGDAVWLLYGAINAVITFAAGGLLRLLLLHWRHDRARHRDGP